jgi:uncharacterized OB-fold protein
MQPANKPSRPIQTPSSYTKPFWDGARDKKLMLQYDPASQAFQFWPRPASLRTGKANLEWRQATGKGRLYAFTTVHVPGPGFEDRVPYLVGLIELDEGVRIVANFVGLGPEDAKIGMPMRVTWEPLGDSNYYAFEPDV